MIFNKNTLQQIAGFSNQIIAEEIVYGQKRFWNLAFNANGSPVDLTDVTIDAKIIRREISNIVETSKGLTFDIADYDPPPTAIDLTIYNRDDVNGKFTLVIDNNMWDLVDSDPELDIAAENCVAFSGRIKIGYPAVGSTPAQDSIIFLLFLIRSDGVVN